MRKRTFTIDCLTNKTLCLKLQSILENFIDRAFPPNGSECAQATRASLQAFNSKIATSEDNCEINTRQRPLLKTAINWYYEEVSQNEAQHQALLSLIAKKKKKIN